MKLIIGVALACDLRHIVGLRSEWASATWQDATVFVFPVCALHQRSGDQCFAFSQEGSFFACLGIHEGYYAVKVETATSHFRRFAFHFFLKHEAVQAWVWFEFWSAKWWCAKLIAQVADSAIMESSVAMLPSGN